MDDLTVGNEIAFECVDATKIADAEADFSCDGTVPYVAGSYYVGSDPDEGYLVLEIPETYNVAAANPDGAELTLAIQANAGGASFISSYTAADIEAAVHMQTYTVIIQPSTSLEEKEGVLWNTASGEF